MKFELVAPSLIRFRNEGGGGSTWLFILSFIFTIVFTTPTYPQAKPAGLKTIHLKFIEKYQPKVSISEHSARAGVAAMDLVSEKYHATSIHRIFPEAGKYEKAHKAFGLHLWYEIQFDDRARLEDAIEDYRSLGYFYNVEEPQEYTSDWETASAVPPLPTGTNDPLFSEQWHFENTGQGGGKPGADINLLKAWKIETGSPNVIVAIIDGGIKLDHPDLAGALWTNASEIPGNNMDDDHNGYVDDIHGYNFGDKTSTIFPGGHATHVAGTIGAISNNGIGVSGIAGGSGTGNGVRLMSCQGFGDFSTGGFEAAMVYAADNGAIISQNSWTGSSTAIEAAIDYFVNRAGYDNSDANFNSNLQTGPMAGGLVIFAAGNSNTSDKKNGYPASYISAIAVASTDQNDIKSSFSNYGTWVDIAAPGSNVFSTSFPTYRALSGTSMACPHVSGVAALVVSNLQRPGLTARDVWDRIRISARDISVENPAMKGLLGAGRLDAYGALRDSDAIPPGPITDLHAKEIKNSSVLLEWTASGEDGNNGQAATYEIRYSKSPINDANFNNATRVLTPPIPPPSGGTVTFEVFDLALSTTYYLALKSKDIFNNISALSNVLIFNTANPPIAEVITTELSEQLFSGGVSTREVLVKNSGSGNLYLRLGVPQISPASVGPPTNAQGVLFAINAALNTIEKIDSKTGKVVKSILMPESSSRFSDGLAFDGTELYYGSSNIVYKINAESGEVIRSFPLQNVSRIQGFAWSGRYLYASVEWSGSGVGILEIDVDDGHVVRIFDYHGYEMTSGGSRESIFFATNNSVVELEISTGKAIREFYVDGNPHGLAYSETEKVIFVSIGQKIQALDPVSGELRFEFPYPFTPALAADEYQRGWIEVADRITSIGPGTTSAIPITFVATELSSGRWLGVINAIPVGVGLNPIPISLSLNVVGAADIEIGQEIDFGSQYLGFPIDTMITIENRGIDELTIQNIQSTDSRVNTSRHSLTLVPGQKESIKVTVTPLTTGSIDAILTIVSNDPDEGILNVPVHADILPSPGIQVSAPPLTTTLLTGESKTLNFTMQNSGGSTLHWGLIYSGMVPEHISPTPKTGDLTAGSTQNFSVNVDAIGLNGGIYTGTLRVFSNRPALEGLIPITVTVIGVPDIAFSRTSSDIGEVHIGTGRPVYFSVKNNGTATLNISNITSDRPDFIIATSSYTIEPGDSIDVAPVFIPSTTGPQTGTFTAYSNDPDEGIVQFVVTGKGVYPPIPGITPGSLSANLITGAKSVHQLTLTNTGGSNMDYALDVAPKVDWLAVDLYGDLPPGQTRSIDIIMDASKKGSGTYVGNIRFHVHGETISEIPATMSVVSAPDIVTTRQRIDFGEQFIGRDYDSILVIKNDGVLPLSILAINSDSPAFTTDSSGPVYLAPDQQVTVIIRFKPTAVKNEIGSITITSNDPDEGTYIIPVIGTGIKPPKIEATPGEIVVAGLSYESTTKTLVIHNSGESVLRWRIREFSSMESSEDQTGPITLPLFSENFTTKNPAPSKLINLVVNPISGTIYAQSPTNRRMYTYNYFSDTWVSVVGTPAIEYESGGSVFLNSVMYSVYSSNVATILAYDSYNATWKSIPNGLGFGTGTITSDGTLLYLAGGGNFKSYHPVTGTWTDLPLPIFTLDGNGGISYFEGFIYAHEGDGKGFARYSVAIGKWETLPPVPETTVLGCTIDDAKKRYYAYGKKGSASYVYEYDIAANIWNVLPFAGFEVGDGGLVYTPYSGAGGVYFIQGKEGRGFARYESTAELPWLRTTPLAGELAPSDSQVVGINLHAYNLNTGTYEGGLLLISNDPDVDTLSIPVTLQVTNLGPVISVPDEISETIVHSVPHKTLMHIENKGQDMLQWRSDNILPAGVSLSKNSGNIVGLGIEDVEVMLDANVITDYLNFTLNINSNDKFNPIVSTRINIAIITNHPPVALPVYSRALKLALQLELTSIFYDPDNDPLTFDASSSNPDVATVSITGTTLSVYPMGAGTSTITATATDIYHFSATTSFTVTVKRIVTGIELIPEAPPLAAIPNPFDASVIISYYANDPGFSAIAILDVSGKIVWQVRHYAEVFGKNEIEFDGTQLSPGIYHCRLVRADNKISTIRLIKY